MRAAADAVNQVSRFREEHRFLSNFWPSPLMLGIHIYPTLEHAYQAAKAVEASDREWIRSAETPGQAKRRGQSVECRTDWDDVKLEVMRDLLYLKFMRGSLLAEKLDQTGDAHLAEGNTWGDTFWGVDETQGGLNHLGQLLMEIRQFNRDAVVDVRSNRPFDVYVGRRGHGLGPGFLGNPVRTGFRCPACGQVHHDRMETIECFETLARRAIARDAAYAARVRGLYRKRLGCFCAPRACHGDVLVRLSIEIHCGATPLPPIPKAIEALEHVLEDIDD